MVKTVRHKKRKEGYFEREEGLQNYSSRTIAADVKSLKAGMQGNTHRLPFGVLLQIMRAYSNFLAGGTIKTDTFTSYS